MQSLFCSPVRVRPSFTNTTCYFLWSSLPLSSSPPRNGTILSCVEILATYAVASAVIRPIWQIQAVPRRAVHQVLVVNSRCVSRTAPWPTILNIHRLVVPVVTKSTASTRHNSLDHQHRPHHHRWCDNQCDEHGPQTPLRQLAHRHSVTKKTTAYLHLTVKLSNYTKLRSPFTVLPHRWPYNLYNLTNIIMTLIIHVR